MREHCWKGMVDLATKDLNWGWKMEGKEVNDKRYSFYMLSIHLEEDSAKAPQRSQAMGPFIYIYI